MKSMNFEWKVPHPHPEVDKYFILFFKPRLHNSKSIIGFYYLTSRFGIEHPRSGGSQQRRKIASMSA